MSLTFPNDPFLGQTVEHEYVHAETGEVIKRSWKWNGATMGWVSLGGGGGGVGGLSPSLFVRKSGDTMEGGLSGPFLDFINAEIDSLTAGSIFLSSPSTNPQSNEVISREYFDDSVEKNNNLITNGNFEVWQRGKQFRYLSDTRLRNQTKKQIGFNYFNVEHFANYRSPHSFIEGRYRAPYYNYNRMYSAAADRWVFGWENNDIEELYPEAPVTGSGFYVYRGFVNSEDADHLKKSKYFCRISTSPPPSNSPNRDESSISTFPLLFVSFANATNETSPNGLTFGAIINNLLSDDRPSELQGPTSDRRRTTDVQYVTNYFDPYNTCIPITGNSDTQSSSRMRDNFFAGFSQTISHKDFRKMNFGTEKAKNLSLKFYARSNNTGPYYVTFTNGGPNTLGYGDYQKRGRLKVKGFYIDQPNEWKLYQIPCSGDTINESISGDAGGCWIDPNRSDSDVGLQVNFCLGSSIEFQGTESSWSSVAAGYYHSLAIKTDGSLWAWGLNGNGQLGLGDDDDRSSPVQVGGEETTWSSVAAGGHYSLAIKNDGSLWAWGRNDDGQLGNGTQTNESSPVQIGGETAWSSVVAGGYHSLAIKNDGSLWAWGLNDDGQLGDGTNENRLSPVQIGGETAWSSVVAGGYHSLAIKNDGSLWAWGRNFFGQLGDGTQTNESSPVQIGGETAWSSVAAGGAHSLAIKNDGSLWAWGSNGGGQLGDGTQTGKLSPVQIGGETAWSSVAAGGSYSLAIKTDGTLWAWGYNIFGQLGDGTYENRLSPVPIEDQETWSSVAAGNYHSFAIKTDGSLWAWGDNGFGRLGLGDDDDRSTPTFLSLITENNIPLNEWVYPESSNFWGASGQVNLLGSTGNYFDIAEVALVDSTNTEDIYFPKSDSEILSECQKYYRKIAIFESSTPSVPSWTTGVIDGTDYVFYVNTNEKEIGVRDSLRYPKTTNLYQNLYSNQGQANGSSGVRYNIPLAEVAFSRIFNTISTINGTLIFPAKAENAVNNNSNTYDYNFDGGLTWQYNFSGDDNGEYDNTEMVGIITGHQNSIFQEGTNPTYPNIPNYYLQRYGWDSGEDIKNYFKYPYGYRGFATPHVQFYAPYYSDPKGKFLENGSWSVVIRYSHYSGGYRDAALYGGVEIDSEYTYGD